MIPRDRTLVSKYRTEMSEILCQEPHGAVKTDERCHRGVFIHRLLYASHALRTQLSLSHTHTHTHTHTFLFLCLISMSSLLPFLPILYSSLPSSPSHLVFISVIVCCRAGA